MFAEMFCCSSYEQNLIKIDPLMGLNLIYGPWFPLNNSPDNDSDGGCTPFSRPAAPIMSFRVRTKTNHFLKLTELHYP